MDYKSAARAGLLHDLFLYDWHNQPRKKLFEKHGYTHPRTALNNASNNFDLNYKEKDIILKHMWPLTLKSVPRYKESFLVSIVDKYSSCGEYAHADSQRIHRAGCGTGFLCGSDPFGYGNT